MRSDVRFSICCVVVLEDTVFKVFYRKFFGHGSIYAPISTQRWTRFTLPFPFCRQLFFTAPMVGTPNFEVRSERLAVQCVFDVTTVPCGGCFGLVHEGMAVQCVRCVMLPQCHVGDVLG